MIGIFKKISASTGIRQTLITIVGNTLATGLSALALILISRLLGPEKFGVFSVGFSVMLILQRVNDFGLNAAMLKFAGASQDNDQRRSIFNFILKCKLIISLIIGSIGLLSYQYLASWLHFSHASILLLAITIGLSSVYYEHLITILQSIYAFSEAVLANGMQSFLKLVLALATFGGGFASLNWLTALYMLAPLVPTLAAKLFLPKWVMQKNLPLSSEFRHKIWQMTKHSAIAFIAAGLIENLDVLFVQRYLNEYETGLLGGVSRIALLFSLVAFSLGNVLNPRVARYQEKIHLQTYLKKSLLVLVAAFTGFLLFIPFARWSIFLTIGPDYLPGQTILLLLVAASFITIATMPFIAMFYSYDSSWYFSVSGILQLLIVVVGNAWFVPQYGLMAAAYTRLIMRLFLFIFTSGLALLIYRKKYVSIQAVQTTTEATA